MKHHCSLSMSLRWSPFLVKTPLSLDEFCGADAVDDYTVPFYVKNVHPPFVVADHVAGLGVVSADVGIPAGSVEVGEDREGKNLGQHALVISSGPINGLDLA